MRATDRPHTTHHKRIEHMTHIEVLPRCQDGSVGVVDPAAGHRERVGTASASVDAGDGGRNAFLAGQNPNNLPLRKNNGP